MATSLPWVQGLRSQLRLSVGPAWRIGEQRGKAKLDVRFDDGTRQTTVLPCRWLPADANQIQRSVEQIDALVAAGRTLQEAKAHIFGGTAPAPPSGAKGEHDLLATWGKFGDFKRKTGAIKASTWAKDYRKTQERLAAVEGDATTAKDLLTVIGDPWPAGSRRRQIVVQQVAAMLRWACDEGQLPPDRWTPPSSLDRFKGQAPARPDAAKPLTDDQILRLLEQLPNDAAGQRWAYALRLMAAYGLRPVEVLHLEIRPDGHLWCDYIKRSGGGDTKPRQLRALHPEWEQEWNLLERLAAHEALPPFGGGVADAGRRYLIRQDSWRPLAAEGLTLYGFRHGYALRAHSQYNIPPRIAAALMGHSVDTHQRVYSDWTDSHTIDQVLAQALHYRNTTKLTDGPVSRLG
jgi:integrase